MLIGEINLLERKIQVKSISIALSPLFILTKIFQKTNWKQQYQIQEDVFPLVFQGTKTATTKKDLKYIFLG